MKYQYANPHIVQRFEDWWRRDNHGLPLMRVVAKKDAPAGMIPPERPKDEKARYTDFDYLMAKIRYDIATHVFLADSYASLGADLGPGSLALYLGSEPVFTPTTVWYQPCIEDPEAHPPIAFDAENPWWKLHVDLIRRLKEARGTSSALTFPT